MASLEGLSAKDYHELITPREVFDSIGARVFTSTPKGAPNPYEELLKEKEEDD